MIVIIGIAIVILWIVIVGVYNFFREADFQVWKSKINEWKIKFSSASYITNFMLILLLLAVGSSNNTNFTRYQEERAINREYESKEYHIFEDAKTMLSEGKSEKALLQLSLTESSPKYAQVARELQIEYYQSQGQYQKALGVKKRTPERLKDLAYYLDIGELHLMLDNEVEAVKHFKFTAKKGSSRGRKLYEKYNPYISVISHYVTLCCDGSHSDAKGQGACSWHGGVCDWNYPVYKEVRKHNI